MATNIKLENLSTNSSRYVYIIESNLDYEGPWLQGVFDTFEKAHDTLKNIKPSEYFYYTVKKVKLNTQRCRTQAWMYRHQTDTFEPLSSYVPESDSSTS